ESTPISKSDPRVGSPRIIELCDLWRAQLTDADPAHHSGPTSRLEQSEALQEFFATEAEIQQRWESERRQAGAPIWQSIEQVVSALEGALSRLQTPENLEGGNPVIAALFQAVAVDVRDLQGDLVEYRRRALAEQALVPDGAGSPDPR